MSRWGQPALSEAKGTPPKLRDPCRGIRPPQPSAKRLVPMRLDRRFLLGLFLALSTPLAYACASAATDTGAPARAPAQPDRQEQAVSLADCGPAPQAGPVFLESQLAQGPRLISAGRLDYPSVLRSAGIIGRVRIGYVIDSLGRVVPRSVVVLYATHPGFVESALATIEDSRYAPGVAEGRPVAVCTVTTVHFTP